MDQEIEFGELEQVEPKTELRPDRNRHFAVVRVHAPRADELPIFVDLDALRDMEAHAQSDTRVELGGVLLGGQHHDEQGRPFVLITDSLRALHYQATKGSFKFTHETWEQISRERDEFPPELQMVGWYHTHPDWGVFLSGMDQFICDHFFNKPLDVALVIDPCRRDRGFFQWTEDPEDRLRRTGGFYLIASRFRQYELEQYAVQLEEQHTMSADPRSSLAGHLPYPVVHVGSNQPAWLSAAVMGAFALQFCLLLVLVLQISRVPGGGLPADALATPGGQPQRSLELREAEMEARLAVLDQVVATFDGSADELVSQLADRTGEVAELRDDLRARRVFTSDLEQQIGSLQAALQTYRERETLQLREVESLRSEVDQLTAAIEKEENASADASGQPGLGGWTFWGWLLAAAAIGVIGGSGLTHLYGNPFQAKSAEEVEEWPAAANNMEETRPGEKGMPHDE